MFNRLNLQQRLKFLVIFSCLALMVSSALGLYGMQASHEAFRTLYEGQKMSTPAIAAPIIKEVQTAYDARYHWIAGAMGLAFILVGLVGYLTINSIAQIAELARDALKRMASGDFTVRVDYCGGILKRIIADINGMAKRLQAVFSEVNQASTQLAASAAELSTVTETTAHDINKQQNETAQVMSAMTEMSLATQSIANNASQAAMAADNADKQANEGTQIVAQAITVIQGMTEEMKNSTVAIHRLQQESTNIGAVLKTIKGIADQTNLLALNAAIEAARAGEQGRGFAVVADEVRTLAGRTQQATIEIQSMITSLQGGSSDAVHTIEKSSERVLAGVTQATQASKTLNAITGVVNKITEMNTQIASAAEEQNAVVEDMNRNIASIGQISAKTADGAHRTAQASIGLAALAAQLRTTLSQFKL